MTESNRPQEENSTSPGDTCLFRSDVQTEKYQFFAIRGCMKSGTNWVGNLLNLHPDISAHGEFHWDRVLVPMNENFAKRRTLVRHGVDKNIKSRMQRLIKESLLDLADEDAIWIGDRTPGAIKPLILPDARYISIQRDGRDVLVSRAYHQLRMGESYHLCQTDPTWHELASRFQSDANCFEEHPELLLSCKAFVLETAQIWHDIIQSDRATTRQDPDVRVLFVKYEDLHRDVEQWRDKMYRFLDVDPAKAKPLSENAKPGFEMDNTKFYRHGQVGEWRKHYPPTVAEWFNSIAKSSLVELGYMNE